MTVHNKLVRDKIVQLIGEKGEICTHRILNDKEYAIELKKKLKEEVLEYFLGNNDQACLEELADLLEVIRALSIIHGSTPEELEQLRKEKEEKRGGFLDKVFLVES